MSEFGDGFRVAAEVHELKSEVARLAKALLDHEEAPGAHANAFNAHGMSPGPVEDAEEVAVEIIEAAQDIAEETVAAVTAAGEDAVEAVTDATEAAAEVPAEAVDEVTETPADDSQPSAGEGGEEPKGEGERAPERKHLLHRKLF